MSANEPDEELIAAFKAFGASSVDDKITFEKLKDALAEQGAHEEFNDEDLQIIFDEIAEASNKPLLEE